MKLNSAIFYSNSIESCLDFYQNILGLELEYNHDNNYLSFLFGNNVRLGIKKASKKRENPGNQTIIIEVGNIEEKYKQLKRKSVIFYEELTETDWGTTFSILDPDENKVEFLKH